MAAGERGRERKGEGERAESSRVGRKDGGSNKEQEERDKEGRKERAEVIGDSEA